MPLYSYKCPECTNSVTIFKPLTLLNREERCGRCESVLDRQICAPAVVGDYAGYSCPVTGKWIEGRRAHVENLKQQGCRVLEPGETEQTRRNRQSAEAALDKSVEQTVEQFYEALPTASREKLAQEVQSGVDVSIERL